MCISFDDVNKCSLPHNFCHRCKNAFGKFTPSTVVARRRLRKARNYNSYTCDYTFCEVIYFLTWGFCCARHAAGSIEERFVYDCKYEDDYIDKFLPEECLKKRPTIVEEDTKRDNEV